MRKNALIGTLLLSTLLLTACGSQSASSSNNSSSSSSVTKQSQSSSDASYKTNANIKDTGDSENPPADYQAAFNKAVVYSKMPMSKKGIYNQLTSSAEKFTPDQANYAIHYLYKAGVNWNDNALQKAKTYSSIGMSSDMIKSQLTSFAEGFTDSQANYAINHLS